MLEPRVVWKAKPRFTRIGKRWRPAEQESTASVEYEYNMIIVRVDAGRGKGSNWGK